MILILGYVTPNRREVPEVLYLGSDGDQAAAAIAKATHPRLERLDHPITRTVRAWSQEQADAHSASLSEETPASDQPSESQPSARKKKA